MSIDANVEHILSILQVFEHQVYHVIIVVFKILALLIKVIGSDRTTLCVEHVYAIDT